MTYHLGSGCWLVIIALNRLISAHMANSRYFKCTSKWEIQLFVCFKGNMGKPQEPRNDYYINAVYRATRNMALAFLIIQRTLALQLVLIGLNPTQCIWLPTNYCAILQMHLFYHMDHCVSSILELCAIKLYKRHYIKHSCSSK